VRQERRPRARGAHHRLPTVAVSDSNDFSDAESDDGLDKPGDEHGVRHLYRDATWLQNSFEYSPRRKEFIGSLGPSRVDHRMPTIMMLFRLFWPDRRMKRTVTRGRKMGTGDNRVDVLGEI
jgi:hypothetical protein